MLSHTSGRATRLGSVVSLLLLTTVSACAVEPVEEDPGSAESAFAAPLVNVYPAATAASLTRTVSSGALTCPAQAIGFWTPDSTKDEDAFLGGSGCSGVLVGKRTIITAKHCGLIPGRTFYWFPGEDPKSGLTWKARRADIESFTGATWPVDRATVKLKSDSPVTPAVEATSTPAVGTTALKAAGFSGGTACHAEDVGTVLSTWPIGKTITTSATPPKMVRGDSGGPLYTVDGSTVTVYGVDKGDTVAKDSSGKSGTRDIFTKIN